MFISIEKIHQFTGERLGVVYINTKLTNAGKAETLKTLPKVPMYGLISQVISTGNDETDEKINHARNLFFSELPSIDKMRSACETLSYVLEPIRKDLNSFFAQKDISEFFLIVNNFDIRHNKENTMNLIYPEQLEWVYFSLLNTINTYSKLKKNHHKPQPLTAAPLPHPPTFKI